MQDRVFSIDLPRELTPNPFADTTNSGGDVISERVSKQQCRERHTCRMRSNGITTQKFDLPGGGESDLAVTEIDAHNGLSVVNDTTQSRGIISPLPSLRHALRGMQRLHAISDLY